MVVLEVLETRVTIKFCVKLGYEQTEMFNLLQRGGDALEIISEKVLKWHMRLKQGQKSIQDGPRSRCRKINSGKLVTHYERRSLGSFSNTRKLVTRPYSKDVLIITRSVPQKMDNILKTIKY